MVENLKNNNKIIPFFIPMEGCREHCIYCDQKAISGQSKSPSPQEVFARIAAWKEEIPPQAAFYGGSFTALSREKQAAYLTPAKEALTKGQISGIRVSTRPDCIDNSILDFLSQFGVKTIELGIQSFSDKVLAAAKRGYNGETAQAACKLVKSKNLNLGIQLMPGLPGDDLKTSLFSAQVAAGFLPQSARIYPTIVIAGTELESSYQKGLYQPLALNEAVTLCQKIWAIFEAKKINVIRIGLNPLEDESKVIAGPYHPAFGHFVKSALKQKQIFHLLKGQDKDNALCLRMPKNDLAQVMGQNKSGWLNLIKAYPNLSRKVDNSLKPGAIAFEENILYWQEFVNMYAEAIIYQYLPPYLQLK